MPSPGRRLSRNPLLLPAGACPECRPGEWSVATDWPSEPRPETAAGCRGGVDDVLERAAKLIEERLEAEFRGYAGGVLVADGQDVRPYLEAEARGELERILTPVADPQGSCQVVGIVLPAGSEFIGFQYEAADRNGRGFCLPDQECQIGQAIWRGNPVLHQGEVTVVFANFENLSTERKREARLKVYFRPASGWLPPN